jgi:hypothetical protein
LLDFPPQASLITDGYERRWNWETIGCTGDVAQKICAVELPAHRSERCIPRRELREEEIGGGRRELRTLRVPGMEIRTAVAVCCRKKRMKHVLLLLPALALPSS